LVQKGEPYTYFRRIPIHAAHGAELTDQTLAGVVLRSTRPTVMPGVMYRMFSAKAKLERHRQITGFTGTHDVVVRSVDGRPVPLHVDGDYIGDVTEARYSVDEQPLLVVS
jgi:diacylglycerol kinase family enzyme